MRTYTVFYVKPEHWRRFSLGDEQPTFSELFNTHAELRTIEAENLEDVFFRMQGEVWSPNGEARELIGRLGLSHTSMSVGDVVRDDNGVYHAVASFGFKEIGRTIKCRFCHKSVTKPCQDMLAESKCINRHWL